MEAVRSISVTQRTDIITQKYILAYNDHNNLITVTNVLTYTTKPQKMTPDKTYYNIFVVPATELNKLFIDSTFIPQLFYPNTTTLKADRLLFDWLRNCHFESFLSY